MALKRSLTKNIYGQDIEFKDVYFNIFNVDGDKALIKLSVSAHSNGHLLETKEYNFVPSVDDGASNFYKQGYEYLKTLPEYASAVDV